MTRDRSLDASEAFADPVGYETWFETSLGALVGDLERVVLQRSLGGMTGGIVVDVGAGTGHFTRLLARSCHVVAVGPSKAMLGEARRLDTGLAMSHCVGVVPSGI